MSDTYSMEAHCKNCGESWTINIPQGVTVEKQEKMTICDNCKCGNISIDPFMRFN